MTTPTSVSGAKLSAGYFFLSLGVLVSLITSVTSFLNLVFETLNKRFPDVLNATYQYGYSTYEYEGLRSALSILIIFFPVFLLLSYFWYKWEKKGLGSVDELIRKWVIYIILFLSSLVTIIDLVTLVRYFIAGEITTRFIYKVLVVFVVALFVGAHYILVLQGRKKVFRAPVGPWSAGKAFVLVLAMIIWSFSVMGSPATQRQLRLDDRRVNDLQSIQWQVINYWQQKERLPKTLEELNNPLSGSYLPVPPEFEKGEKYEYSTKGWMKFELCATFALPMPEGWREYGGVRPFYGMGGDSEAISYPYPGGGVNESWDHEAGRTCFERTIDPDMFPPFSKG